MANVGFVQVAFPTVVHELDGACGSLLVGFVGERESQNPQVVVFVRVVGWVGLDLGVNRANSRFVVLNEVAHAWTIVILVDEGKWVRFGTILVDPRPCLDG